jgi:hypothetical protein
MAAPDPNNYESPTMASSEWKISKEGIESKHSVPGEHTSTLLSSVALTICAVLAVVAPILTFEIADGWMNPTWTLVVVLVQEFVILCVAGMAWIARKR